MRMPELFPEVRGAQSEPKSEPKLRAKVRAKVTAEVRAMIVIEIHDRHSLYKMKNSVVITEGYKGE